MKNIHSYITSFAIFSSLLFTNAVYTQPLGLHEARLIKPARSGHPEIIEKIDLSVSDPITQESFENLIKEQLVKEKRPAYILVRLETEQDGKKFIHYFDLPEIHTWFFGNFPSFPYQQALPKSNPLNNLPIEAKNMDYFYLLNPSQKDFFYLGNGSSFFSPTSVAEQGASMSEFVLANYTANKEARKRASGRLLDIIKGINNNRSLTQQIASQKEPHRKEELLNKKLGIFLLGAPFDQAIRNDIMRSVLDVAQVYAQRKNVSKAANIAKRGLELVSGWGCSKYPVDANLISDLRVLAPAPAITPKPQPEKKADLEALLHNLALSLYDLESAISK